MGLRKQKAARLKVQILDQTVKLIGKKPFEDLFVDEICAKVKISKVTFFKYFPQKEDILLYYFRLWCFDCSVELQSKPREGLQGVYYLAEKLSEACENHPGLMLSLIGYLADLKRPPKPFPVKAEEKQLLYPGKPDILTLDILSLEQMLEKFSLEAVFKKEITKTSSTREVTHLFMTCLLGSVVTAHINQISPLRYFFKKNLELVVKGLQ
ncbi:MAG: TetR/AcrR family transcriptional regulator [Cyclobacteriaceae bacterium]|nr:TetR/AcrR family transcriptional regulator [Cyclobacteriaceae bacterium]